MSRQPGPAICAPLLSNSAEATLRAEATLQSFLQTLTRDFFAQLPIGLAVFDKDRRLQLFNPALADLTGLAVDFLSRRPTLLAVLDALQGEKRCCQSRATIAPGSARWSRWKGLPPRAFMKRPGTCLMARSSASPAVRTPTAPWP